MGGLSGLTREKHSSLLKHHLEEPFGWKAGSVPVLLPAKRRALEAAAKLVGASPDDVETALPTMCLFPSLLDDARGVIQAEPSAIVRFEDTLVALERTTPSLPDGKSAGMEKVWQQAGQFLADFDARRGGAVDADTAAAVLTAVCLTARHRPERADRWLALAQQQLEQTAIAARLADADQRHTSDAEAEPAYWRGLWEASKRAREAPALRRSTNSVFARDVTTVAEFVPLIARRVTRCTRGAPVQARS